MPLDKKMSVSVRNLSRAFCEVLKNWDETHDEVNPLGEEGCYPFERDLEEMQCRVQNWAERLEELSASEILEIGLAAKHETPLKQGLSDFLPSEINQMIEDRLRVGSLNGFVSMPSNQWIVNPFVDETMREEVDPVTYYGEENILIALSPPKDGETNAENDPDFHLHPQWQPEEDGGLANLEAIKEALGQHVVNFLDDMATTGEYNEKFDLKITIGDKTFNLPLGAQLTQDFEKMIQTEIDDLTDQIDPHQQKYPN